MVYTAWFFLKTNNANVLASDVLATSGAVLTDGFNFQHQVSN